jgi:hypothetical protein
MVEHIQSDRLPDGFATISAAMSAAPGYFQ